MMHTNSFDWFRLARTKGIGTKFLWDVYDFTSKESLSLSDLFIDDKINAPSIPTKLRTKFASSLIDQDYEALSTAYERLEQNRVKILHVESSDFPKRLKRYGREYGIPPLLYARGHIPLANSQSISIRHLQK